MTTPHLSKDEKIKALQKELSARVLCHAYASSGRNVFWICCGRDKKAGHKNNCKVGRLLA